VARYDVHQHLWPEELAAALAARGEPPRLRGATLELAEGSHEVDLRAHDLDARLALLDRDEVDVAVVSLPPTLGLEPYPELMDAYHEGILRLVSAAGGRLRALAAGEAREGFAGACVAASSLLHEPSPSLHRLLGRLDQAGGVLFVHPGPGPGTDGRPDWWAAVVDYPAQMQAAYAVWLAHGASAYPRLNVIFAILAGGGPFHLERLRSRWPEAPGSLPDTVFLDTASYGRRALELCLATFGVGHLVYGSDTPVVASGPTLRAVREFGEAVADTVCSQNPSRLFP
jgi:predicted TIM-barrel fold metal-dependent hydrolase